MLGAATIAIIVGFFIFDAMKYQSTDDAYVETTTVSVSPKVSGQIVKVLVKDNQAVKAGDVVAVIDKIDYQVKLEQATAAYERALCRRVDCKRLVRKFLQKIHHMLCRNCDPAFFGSVLYLDLSPEGEFRV